MNLIKAARLCDAAYDGPFDFDQDGVQAVVKGGVLFIVGTNELSDWGKNFRAGATRTWHSGWLAGAEAIYPFAKKVRPHLIVGHSKGAGEAQILAYSLKKPAICFASPKPHYAARKWHGGRHVLNINRSDDIVAKMPPFRRFHHIGIVETIKIPRRNWGEDHSLPRYIEAMKDADIREDWG